MSDITLRSFQQILGMMAAKIQSETDGNDLSEGSFLLTLLEAAASSDFSIEGKLLRILNLRNIDKTNGVDLQNLAFEMGLVPSRLGAQPANASLTVSDKAFTKITSNIYAGSASPAAGDTELRIVDGSSFKPTGTVYVGRGTETSESLAYVSIVNTGSYWKLNLSSPLAKDHLVGEEVVLAQGGNRTIPAGTIVRVPAGAGALVISFKTTVSQILLDGEQSISGLAAVATEPGSQGIVGRNKITDFSAKPWTSAVVGNLEPSTGGRDPESDPELRQRIKDHVHELGKGTQRAIIRAVIGTTDDAEGKRVVSAFLREPTSTDERGILFIDDGTGFAPSFSGIGEEVIVTSANGTESFFQLQKWSLVKAQATSIGQEPFNLSGGEELYIEVDGQFEQRSFPSSAFRTPGVALAQEVAESINKTFTTIEARAKDGQLFISPISDNPDWVRVGAATSGIDANKALRFPIRRAYTIRLYKNDVLLEKNGSEAIIQSLPNTQWPVYTSGETIQFTIDGILSPLVAFVDADFALYTSSTTILSATVSDWVKIINAKFIGITATARDDGTFTVKSNKGRILAASVAVTGGTLQTKMFPANSKGTGKESDYKLNTLLGQLELSSRLTAGDELKAGTVNTKGFFLTNAQAVFNLSATNGIEAQVIFVPDASVNIILVPQLYLQSFSVPAAGIQRISGNVGQYSNVKADDWVHSYNMPRTAMIRVSSVSANGQYIDCYDPSPATGTATLDGLNKTIHVFRTSGLPQLCKLPVGSSITGSDLVTSIQSQILGIDVALTDTGAIRIATTRYSSESALGIPSQGGSAGNLGITSGSYASNDPHTAAIESDDLTGIAQGRIVVSITDVDGTPDRLSAQGTPFDAPEFSNRGVQNYLGASSGYVREPADRTSVSELEIRQELPIQREGYGTDLRATTVSWMEFGQEDNMVFLIDNDAAKKTFDIPMYVDGTISGTFVPSNTEMDIIDSTGALLGASTRWAGHRFEDYRVWFQARTTLPASNANSQIKITSVPFGPNGTHIKFGIFYPTAPASATTAAFSTAHANASFSTDPADDEILVQLSLASGDERSIGLTPNKRVYIDVSGSSIPYTQKVSFLYPVDLSTVLVGDVVSIQDPAFDSTNRGEMRVQSISTLVDFSKSYQFLPETTIGAVTGGTALNIEAITDTVRIGDKVQIIGARKQAQTIYNNLLSNSVTAVGIGTVQVDAGAYKPSNGIFKVGLQTYSYTTYTLATKTFSGVSPNPSGVIAIGNTLIQNNYTVEVTDGANFLTSGQFQSNAVTFTYQQYASGKFEYVTPDPTGLITAGSNVTQSFTGMTTTVLTVGNQTDFMLADTIPSGSGQLLVLTHKTLSVSANPSYTVIAGDKVQVGAITMVITTVIDQSHYTVNTPFAFLGFTGGIVSRINVIGHRSTLGVNESPLVASSTGVRIYEIPTAGNTALELIEIINNTAGIKDLILASNATGSNGTGRVDFSTGEELANGITMLALKNGESFVYATQAISPVIRLKEPTDDAPTIGDKVKLIPTTTRSLVDHFSRKQVSGLTIAADVDMVDGGRKIQVASRTPGGLGQVFAVGGRASGLNVLKVRGTVQEISIYRSQLELDRSAMDILAPGHTIRLYQPGRAKKKWTGASPTASTTLAITKLNLTTGRLTYGVPFVTLLTYTHTGAVTWMVRRVGRSRTRFEIMSGTANLPTGMRADDWVLIGNGDSYAGQTPAQVFSAANEGWFQVRETDNLTYFDVESSGNEEFVTTSTKPFVFTPYHSVRVGDQITIGSDVPVSTLNQGTYIVTNVPSVSSVDYANANAEAQSSVVLGGGVNVISALDQGYLTYRKVVLVAPKPNDPTNRSLLVVSPGYDLSAFNEGQGARLTLPNRLGFGTDPVPGMSGYQYWVGLKQRAQRVVDGYEPDATTFEGTRASGAQIEVREPQIQHVALQFKIKTSKGVSLQSLSDTIKSVVAGYINSLGLGQDVILSECIKLVQQVPGIEAVVLSFPSPTLERITISDSAIARTKSSDITIS